MDYQPYAGYASGALALAYYYFYIRSMVSGPTRPSRVSWFLWSLAIVLAAASQEAGGAIETVWMLRANAVGNSFIFVLSLFYGTWESTKKEKLFI